MKLFLDDERRPGKTWKLVKTPKEVINILDQGEKVEILSLDHDLGLPNETGYDVVTWMEEKAFSDNLWVPPKEIWIHTSNTSAGLKMWAGLLNIQKFSCFPVEIEYKSNSNDFWWEV